MTGPGNWNRVFANGIEITSQQQQTNYKHAYGKNAVMPDGVGMQQYAPGLFDPTYQLQGIYDSHGPGVLSAYNLLSPSGVGNVNDTEFVITELLGMNNLPVVGDCAVLYDGTLMDFARMNPLASQMTLNAQFKSRGKRMPPFPVLIDLETALKTATNISSAPYDDGAEAAAGTSAGGVMVAQITTPTGTAATGNIAVPTQPVANDTVVVNGVTYTWVAAGPTANQVVIGTTALISAQNLFAAITGGVGAGVTYGVGTTSFSQLITNAVAFFSVPAGVNNTITITYATTGTAGNSFTLVKTGTGGLTVSGATLTGGVAGDQYTLTVGSSTTSGGAYTTVATVNNVGPLRAAYRVEVPIGTLINEFVKATWTLSSGTGTVQTLAANIAFGRYWQL